MPDDTALARGVLADQIKDRLLQDIMAGRYPARSRIVETRVARELGTSQAPVREALRGLEALGIVEIAPFRGARVRHPSAAELGEGYAVRSELEALAAALGVPKMTDADLGALVSGVEDMQRLAALGDRHAIAIADAEFHARLIGLSGNRTLQRIWRSLEPFSRTYITLVVPGADPRWTADLHLPIVEALRSRDPERVVAALRTHFSEASARLDTGWQDEEPPPRGPAHRARPRSRPAS